MDTLLEKLPNPLQPCDPPIKIRRKFMTIALILFVSTAVGIVFVRSFWLQEGFHTNWTISRYAGTNAGTAILFALSNFTITLLMIKYFRDVKKTHHLSKIWSWAIGLMIASFFVLSVCPVGLFDPGWGSFGIVSRVHQESAHTLFITMFITAIGSLIEFKNKPRIFIGFTIFLLAYGVFAIFGYSLKPAFFMNNILFFEFFYVVFNLVLYGLMSYRPKVAIIKA